MRQPHPENLQKIVDALKTKPMSIPEIAAAAVVSPPCARNVLHMLQNDGQCFIQRWEIRDASHARTAIYALGKGVDAPRPARESDSTWRRRYKDKLREAICAQDTVKLNEKLIRELSRPAFRHPFDVWLFGAPSSPNEPSQIPRRVYQQDMAVTQDELEEA